MNIKKKRLVALLVSACLVATLGLVGCGGSGNQSQSSGNPVSEAISQMLEGDVTGQVGQEYATKWFTFTVNSLTTDTSYEGFSAADGNKLVIANVTITCTFPEPQAFGTFDWFVMGSNVNNEIWPISPLNDNMMPDNFMLGNKETVTYDVVVEFPANLSNPYFMYTEVDEKGQVFTTFKLPIK